MSGKAGSLMTKTRFRILHIHRLTTPENACAVYATHRWKACRLGAGALFGDRSVRAPQTARNPSRGTENSPPPEPEWSYSPALETAITAEETELLEIGVSSYRRYLAKGVAERRHRAVAVLKATQALVRKLLREFVVALSSLPSRLLGVFSRRHMQGI